MYVKNVIIANEEVRNFFPLYLKMIKFVAKMFSVYHSKNVVTTFYERIYLIFVFICLTRKLILCLPNKRRVFLQYK